MYRYVVAAFFLLTLHTARAVCPLSPTHYRVGADATYCTHNTIQAAIDAVGSCAVVIDITREHLYGSGGFCVPSQSGGCHLHVDGKPVTLQGWGDGTTCYSLSQAICPGCGPGTTLPLVTLDGASGGGPVLSISGASNVHVRNLTIFHGATAYDGSGGGIAFAGSGSLDIENSTLSDNFAGYGGAINFAAAGGTANLTLLANTLILNNTAQFSGGGVRLEGYSHLYVLQAQTLIGYNQATGIDPVHATPSGGYGGGVELVGPAVADIGSSGYNGSGVIFSNTATYGGGVSINAGQDNDLNAYAQLFTTDGANPVALAQNFASQRGGAIYLKSFASGTSGFGEAVACLKNFRISDNAAPDGAAIYADFDSTFTGTDAGSYVQFNRSNGDLATERQCDPGSAAALGETACSAGVACNEIGGNTAEDGNNTSTTGAIILIDHQGELYADRLAMRDNTGGSVLRDIGEGDPGVPFKPSGPRIRNCLLAGNSTSAELLRTEVLFASPLNLESCTIANDSIGAAAVISASAGVALLDDLIVQPGNTVLAGSGSSTAQYVLANEIASLPSDTTVQTVGDPLFVDPAHGDYHLQLLSPAVDYAGGIGGTDLDGYPRDVDLAANPNAFGPRDVGAYERQSGYACDDAPDALFCSPFEPQ